MKAKFGDITAVSNDSAGDQFLMGMIATQRQFADSYKKFDRWCYDNKIWSWHIHDGWVANLRHHNGDVVNGEDGIRVTWLSYHDDSHSPRVPQKGELFAIKSRSPYTEDDQKPFRLYVYRATEVERDTGHYSPTHTFEPVEIKTVWFNKELGNYEFYTPPIKKYISFWSRLLTNFKPKKEEEKQP